MRSVGQVLVDLVGDHPDAVLDRPLADRLDGGRRIDRTRRVVGADEEQHLRSPCTGLLELVDRDLEAALGVRVDDHRYAAGQRDRLGYVVQYGAGQMTSSPGSHKAANAVNTACLPPFVTSTCDPKQSNPLSRLVLSAIASFSSGRPPAGVYRWLRTSRTRGDRGVDDVLRGREVGLTGAEPDHVLALGLQGLGLGVDRQGGRRGDCSESFGGSFHSRQACHSDPPLPTRFPSRVSAR